MRAQTDSRPSRIDAARLGCASRLRPVIWARFSFSRARFSAASERARAPSSSFSAVLTESIEAAHERTKELGAQLDAELTE